MKRGFRNHRFLLGQSFLGGAVTVPGYRMYLFEGYPGVVETAAGAAGYGIRGELWEVTEACLAELDRLEEVDAGVYRRGYVRLEGMEQEALIYLFNREVAGLREVGEIWMQSG